MHRQTERIAELEAALYKAHGILGGLSMGTGGHMGWGCGAWDALRRLGQWGYVEEISSKPRIVYRLTTEDEWRSHVATLEHDLPPAALTGFAK